MLVVAKGFQFLILFFLLSEFFNNPSSHTQAPVQVYFIRNFIEEFFKLSDLDSNENGGFSE